jgi:hypothetical protein
LVKSFGVVRLSLSGQHIIDIALGVLRCLYYGFRLRPDPVDQLIFLLGYDE